MPNKPFKIIRILFSICLICTGLNCKEHVSINENEFVNVTIYNKPFEVKDIKSLYEGVTFEGYTDEYIHALENGFVSVIVTNQSSSKIKLNVLKGNIVFTRKTVYSNGDSLEFNSDAWSGEELIIEPYEVVECGMLHAKDEGIPMFKNSEMNSDFKLFKSDSSIYYIEVSRFNYGYWNKKIILPIIIVKKKFAEGDSVFYKHNFL